MKLSEYSLNTAPVNRTSSTLEDLGLSQSGICRTWRHAGISLQNRL